MFFWFWQLWWNCTCSLKLKSGYFSQYKLSDITVLNFFFFKYLKFILLTFYLLNCLKNVILYNYIYLFLLAWSMNVYYVITLMGTSPVFYLWMCNFHSKLLSDIIHMQENLSWFCSSQLCFYSRQWHGFMFFLFYCGYHSPNADFHSLCSYCHLCLFFFSVAKPSRLPKSHPVSPVVGSFAWLQSSPPPALGSLPTPTWRERKVWHGLQLLMQEHFIWGFI